MGRAPEFIGVAVVGALLVACAQDLSRDEAIVVFQHGGASLAEATCMADSLAVLDRLDAADPFRVLDEDDRRLFVEITERCASDAAEGAGSEISVVEGAALSGQVTGPGVVAGPGEIDDDVDAPTAPGSPPADLDEVRAAAVARLVLAGRSVAFAECVVDQLLALDAQYVLEAEEFGVGSSPLEANAYATCV